MQMLLVFLYATRIDMGGVSRAGCLRTPDYPRSDSGLDPQPQMLPTTCTAADPPHHPHSPFRLIVSQFSYPQPRFQPNRLDISRHHDL
jgi:hypothetical protein